MVWALHPFPAYALGPPPASPTPPYTKAPYISSWCKKPWSEAKRTHSSSLWTKERAGAGLTFPIGFPFGPFPTLSSSNRDTYRSYPGWWWHSAPQKQASETCPKRILSLIKIVLISRGWNTKLLISKNHINPWYRGSRNFKGLFATQRMLEIF